MWIKFIFFIVIEDSNEQIAENKSSDGLFSSVEMKLVNDMNYEIEFLI